MTLRTRSPVIKDNVGLTARDTCRYTVRYPFTGYFYLIDNGEVLNLMTAGDAVRVSFSLEGNRGMDIFAGDPISWWMPCGGLPSDAVERTATATESRLTYNPTNGRYSYVWKTDSNWSGTCRTLRLSFDDGTTRRVYFRFRP